MKILFENLGHIENAVFEDSDLVVIAGDNGSGKTILLESIAIVKEVIDIRMVNLVEDIINDFLCEEKEAQVIDNYLSKEMEEIFRPTVKEKQDTIIKRFEVNNIEFKFKNFNSINSYIEGKISEIIKQAEKSVKTNVLFDENSSLKITLQDYPIINEIAYNYDSMSFFFRDSLYQQLKNVQNQARSINFKTFVNESEVKEFREFSLEKDINFMSFIDYQHLAKEYYRNIIRLHLADLFQRFFRNGKHLYLPSERNIYVKDALAKFIDNDNKTLGLRYGEHSFIKEYISFTQDMKNLKSLIEIPPELKKLIGGTIEFDEDGEVKSLKVNEKDIEKILFSTKINKMLPYLLIFSPAKNYKSITVEEPEAHLSLRSIKDLLEFIKILIENHQIYITTHSDVFFAKLNNFLLKNSKKNVKVYELKLNGEYSFLNEVERNDFGYKIELFAEELELLFEETIETQNEEL